MNTFNMPQTNLTASRIALGCMRITSLSPQQAQSMIKTALDLGINFFDHADIYGGGECEKIFSSAIKLSDDMREKIILQSKCGIRKGFFDFSKQHILNSVDSILSRLQTDYLDILLLHRPDALAIPQEVAEAFDILKSNGKVRNFGVSNQNPMQIELLKKFSTVPIVINQLQFSIMHQGIVSEGLTVNMNHDLSVNRNGSVLDYCRLNDITIQAWSPFMYGFFEGVFLDNDKFPKLNEVITKTANEYNVENTAIALAWILRHPACIQPVVGTMNETRLSQMCKACEINLTREQWYEIYRAAGNILP